jgi:hypothetical protein
MMIIFLVSTASQLATIIQFSLFLLFYNPLAATACFTILHCDSATLSEAHFSPFTIFYAEEYTT